MDIFNKSFFKGSLFNGSLFQTVVFPFCSYTTNTASQSADIKLSLPAGKKITIYWGDDTSTVITGAVTETTYSHTYTDIKTYNLTVSGDYNDITYLDFIGDGSYGGDIKYLPDSLAYFRIGGDNTLSGDIQYLPDNLIYFYVRGQNIIFGDIQYLSSNLTVFHCKGFNTIFGAIQYFPSGLTVFYCKGNNTISDYTGKTWTTNMSSFILTPVSPGGLSSTEMDQLLIDLNNDLDWSEGGQIILTGTNAPRTSASDDAVNNIVAEGGTVITN